MFRSASLGALALLGSQCAALLTPPALAGALTITNESPASISCTLTGAAGHLLVTVPPRQARRVEPGGGPDTLPAITQAECGTLHLRQLAVTPQGPGETMILNGRQRRVLTVSLYPYLPTAPDDRFEALAAHIIRAYQQKNPAVLLNLVMNQDVNIYDFGALPALLGRDGFDVVELDTLYLGFLADSGLINPQSIRGARPLKVARQAASYKGRLWAVPSWLCMDFVYSADPRLANIHTLAELLDYLGERKAAGPSLVGNFNGSWRLPSLYINAYVQRYGGDHRGDALKLPPDPAAIADIIALTDACAAGGANPCTDGTIHDSANGTSEKIFATGGAAGDMGFSEQSFFVSLYGRIDPLYVIPAPLGPRSQPLLFSDAFVTSKANCARRTLCAEDAAAFTTLLTGKPIKDYIVEARDLPQPSPWRTLLAATEDFYTQKKIKNNALYRQYSKIFATAEPFPNSFTKALQADLKTSVCTALKSQRPNYGC